MKCPICTGDLYIHPVDDIVEITDAVCEKHQNWLVTTCTECGNLCLSRTIRLCEKCGAITIDERPNYTGKKDHRAALRSYGLEGFE